MRKQILLAFLLSSLLLPAGAALAAAPSGETDPFVLIPGTWDWAGRAGSCQDNPQTLTLSPDRLKVTLEYKKPVTNPQGKPQKSEVYKILDARARWLHAQVEGETKLGPDGKPVSYDFVFATDNSFCWHRSDWTKGKCTNMMARCPAPAH